MNMHITKKQFKYYLRTHGALARGVCQCMNYLDKGGKYV